MCLYVTSQKTQFISKILKLEFIEISIN